MNALELSRTAAQTLNKLETLHKDLEQVMNKPDVTNELINYQKRLDELDADRMDKGLVEHDGEIPALQPKIIGEVQACQKLIEQIRTQNSSLEKELHHMKDDLSKMLGRTTITLQEFLPIQNRLRSLKAHQVDNSDYLMDTSDKIPPNQAKVNKLLMECYKLSDQVFNKVNTKGSIEE